MKKNEGLINETIIFNFIELTALCEHLEKQEKEGLRLKKIDYKDFVFEQSSKRNIRYSAVIYVNQLLKKDFIDSCEKEGWEYVASYFDELHIFRTQDPFATEIMTDDKENLRTVTKRFLLRPSFFGFSVGFVNSLLQVILRTSTVNIFSVPLAADQITILWTFLLMVTLIPILVKTTDFLFWLIKAKKCVKKGEKIPFVNLAEKKKRTVADRIVIGIGFTVPAFLLFYLFYGYTEDKLLYAAVAISFSIPVIFAVSDWSKYKGAKAYLAMGITAIVFCGVFFAGYFPFKNAYKENAKNFLNYDGIPVSLSDFGFDEDVCEDETQSFYATRLGQYYRFTCFSSKGDGYLRYNVFVSDFPAIRNQYAITIAEDESHTIYTSDKSDWDEQYRIIHDSEYGYAVKDNTVIHLTSYSTEENYAEQDFFDVAYEKLFDKTE